MQIVLCAIQLFKYFSVRHTGYFLTVKQIRFCKSLKCNLNQIKCFVFLFIMTRFQTQAKKKKKRTTKSITYSSSHFLE